MNPEVHRQHANYEGLVTTSSLAFTYCSLAFSMACMQTYCFVLIF